SISRAVARACSEVTVINAFRPGLNFSIRAKHASVRSTGEAALLRSKSKAPFIVRVEGSSDVAKAGFSHHPAAALKPAAKTLRRVQTYFVIGIPVIDHSWA